MMMAHETDLNLKETELRLGVPGAYENEEDEEDTALSLSKTNKRASPETADSNDDDDDPKRISNSSPAAKAQIVGWPPVRSYRKNNLGTKTKTESESGIYVKVSMDGAPYLRKIDLRLYNGYKELIKALENMFKLNIGEYYEREGYKGSEFAPAYDDKDGDLMLVGDVPWEMFVETCKRLRIIRGSDAKGLTSCSVN